MNTVTITKLRGIDSLEFPLPGREGVFLLTGANGAGKSTLLSSLAALQGIEALDHFFVPDIRFSDSRAGDVFADTRICFKTEKKTFEFRCKNHAWFCTDPEFTQEAMYEAGLPQTVYTGGRWKYVPGPDEVYSTKDIQRAPDFIANAASEIFDDPRFHHLYMVKSKQFDKMNLFLIHRFSGGQDYYFSENNFSAGERAVLRLAMILPELPPGSLVLIDEAEMALHPKSQRRLLEKLQHIAQEQKLTFLVSTQSASMIRLSKPQNLLLIEEDEYEHLVCRTNVYPAAVLGEMAFAEDILPEVILLVEDQEASMLLEAIGEKLMISLDHDFPYCKILPVGGYMQVVILMDNLARFYPSYVKRRAVLDQDAAPNIRKTLEGPHRPHFDVVSRNKDNIYFLPCAPEQGVVRLLENDVRRHSENLSRRFSTTIRLTDIMNSYNYRSIGGTSRSDCKDKLSLIVRGIHNLTGEHNDLIRKKLYRYYADKRYSNIQELKEDYCSLIFRR